MPRLPSQQLPGDEILNGLPGALVVESGDRGLEEWQDLGGEVRIAELDGGLGGLLRTSAYALGSKRRAPA